MPTYITLTAPTKNPVAVKTDNIISIYSERYNSMPATFLRLGFGCGQYVLETREWILFELQHLGSNKTNPHEKWMKEEAPTVPAKSTSPTQESAKGAKVPPKTIQTKTPPKSQVIKKGPPKRK